MWQEPKMNATTYETRILALSSPGTEKFNLQIGNSGFVWQEKKKIVVILNNRN